MHEGPPIERFRQGDAAGDIHIRASGRLRAVTEDARGRLNVGGEFGLPNRGAFDKIVDIGYRYAVESPRPEVVARLTGGSA